MNGPGLSDDLRDFAARAAGPVDRAAFVSTGETGATVWALLHASGRRTHLKAHAHRRQARQEMAAYRDWAPHLDEIPRLLAHRLAPCPALLLATLPGDSALLDDAMDPHDVHRRAGRFAARLHGLAFVDADPMPLEDAVQLRLASWRARAARVIDAATLRALTSAIEGGPPLEGSRVPCHRDFQPRNWIVGGDDFGVIDFEHAKPDAPLVDFVRLENGPWRERPTLRDAFFVGYGTPLDETTARRLARLSALDRLATMTWMRERTTARIGESNA